MCSLYSQLSNKLKTWVRSLVRWESLFYETGLFSQQVQKWIFLRGCVFQLFSTFCSNHSEFVGKFLAEQFPPSSRVARFRNRWFLPFLIKISSRWQWVNHSWWRQKKAYFHGIKVKTRNYFQLASESCCIDFRSVWTKDETTLKSKVRSSQPIIQRTAYLLVFQ